MWGGLVNGRTGQKLEEKDNIENKIRQLSEFVWKWLMYTNTESMDQTN